MRAWLPAASAFLGLLGLASCEPSSASKPHIMFLLVDDWGYANLHLHNPTNPEVVTPNLDALVQGGIELEQHYAFQYCSPSRCALQSGRNPIHVNVLNDDIRNHNEASDPVGGFQGIPVSSGVTAASLPLQQYGITWRLHLPKFPPPPPAGEHDHNCGKAFSGGLPVPRRREVERGDGHEAPHPRRAGVQERAYVL